MLHRVSRHWRRWGAAWGLALATVVLTPLLAVAQLSPALRDQFLSDPELTEPRDPLLPELPIQRRLSPLEKRALRGQLDQLAAEAEQLYLVGQTELAFQAWMREVRLRRILGYPEELAAMQRVGLRAWEGSRSLEIQLLTLRLRQIQTDLLGQTPLPLEQLETVAATFEVLRDLDSAIALYELLIQRATQAGDLATRQQLLEKMAALQESWFRFAVAGKTYEDLLAALESGEVSLEQVQYLRGAIRNFQAAGDPAAALTHQRRLLSYYQASAQGQPIPALLLAIARNHRDLDQLERARTAYQTTYVTALAQRQSDVAREALQDLIEIYRRLQRPDQVEYLYEQQLAVERLDYDAYGMMQVFDQLGQFYEAQADPTTAIAAYQEGLVLAQHLAYRVTYFRYQLQRLLLAQGRLTVQPAEQHQHDLDGAALQRPDPWQGNRLNPDT